MSPPSGRPRAGGFLAALVVALLAVCLPVGARADSTQSSLFQDDAHLIYSPPATVNRTLAILKGLGVQQLRVGLLWAVLAPDPSQTNRPAGFDAQNPAAYPASAWTRYDTLVELAARYGIGVEFNVTAPGPLWAMARHPSSARTARQWEPSAAEFEDFVHAAGVRYSGSYEHIPAVRAWSIWNEPNQPGWLAPQWQRIKGRETATSARLYRGFAQAGLAGLYSSGHSRDTILIGELAPEGLAHRGAETAMPPIPFLQALYCLDSRYRRLRGTAAAVLGCPTNGSASAFAKANPALFRATGFAHHPYYFFRPPSAGSPDHNYVPLANLGRLEQGLDRAFRVYHSRRRIPIYLTEYGYQTNPPDPYQTVTPAQQAVYLNEADYMAWRDRRVRSVAQFLLYDAGPDTRYPPSNFDYWDTFQTGLLFADGAAKPAFFTYRMPIWIARPRISRRQRLTVWGQLRPAPHSTPQRALIQWEGSGGKAFRTISTPRVTNSSGYLQTRVRVPGSGTIRIAWTNAAGQLLTSRDVRIRVR